MTDSPTFVLSKLDDKELQESINNMVNSFKSGLESMKETAKEAVGDIQKTLQKLGNTKTDSGGSSDGGASKRAKKQSEETEAVQKTTAARKEYNATLDQTAQAMQKAAGGGKMSVIETYDMQIEVLKNRLRDVRQDIDIFNAAIGSGKKTQVEWGQQGLKQAREEAELLMKQITALESKRGGLLSILAPQGDTIKNFVQSLQKTNPELALLNQQYKEGNALLQQKSSFVRRTAEDERRLAAENAERVRRENSYAATTTQRERERQAEMAKTAQIAQELSRELIKNMSLGSADISTANYDKLTEYFNQMRYLYYNIMSVQERETPVGRALRNDIETVEKARQAIVNYAKASNKILSAEAEGNTGGNLNLEKLRSKIRELTAEYERLTVAEINAGKDKGIVDKFQRISRAAQILQKNLNTPINFDAAKSIQVRTLDDMVYKMHQLNAYKQSIDLTKPDADRKLREVDAELSKLRKDIDKYSSSTKIAEQQTNALTRSLNYMKNRLAFYFTVGASTSFIKNLIEIRAQYEMNERALGILINSAERGSQIFKELSDMALVSPYTLIELSAAAKQLTAYDIAAKDVVDTTRRLADMTAAVGIPIERLTYAIGQVKAYGYLNARDARMFANAGIPLVKELADYYTQLEGHLVSTADVYDKIKKKSIDYNAVMAVVTKMTDEGGKFFDFQAKMAGTLKVQLANLTLAWNNMLNEIGSDSQGMLSSAIGGLKELFLQWRNIEKVINTVLVAVGLWKAAQLTALAATGNLTGAMAAQVVMGTKLQSKFASMATGMKTASIGISAAGMAFWLVLADGIMTYRRNAEEIEQLNKSIAEGAKESAESLSKFLEGPEIYQNRLNAAAGKLPKAEAEKTWEALREQIELTADSSDEIIAKLLDPKKYDNINSRLTAGFEILDSIKNVTSKIGDTFDKLDVSQDSMLFGAFGEGLAEDIDDYNERLKHTTELAGWASKTNKSFWDNAVMGLKSLFGSVKEDLGSSEAEAQEEIRNFAANAAQTIKDELGEEGLKDKIQINEAIARVIQGMENQFPQIRGKGKALFETIFYDVMSTEFEGAVDKQAYYYNLFLSRLKKDHASAFQDVTDGILEDTHTWNSAQLDAIKKTAERVKEDLPAASQDAINQILEQLNKTDFKLRIVTEFATTTQDEVNKLFKEQFINKPYLEDKGERERQETEAMQKYGTLMKKNGETNLEYEDRVRKKREENLKISQDNARIIESNKNKTDEASKAIVANAQEEKAAADDFLESAKKVEDWGGYDFSTKKESSAAKKEQKAAETELAKALKEELQLIDKVRSAYKSLTDDGKNRKDAISLATEGLEESVSNINRVMSKYGLKFDVKKFAGITNPHELVNMLQGQIDRLVNTAKPAEIQSLQLKIKDFKLDAAKFDQKTFANSLNNELGKLDEEYELAVTLDANPELGSAFADMMGLNTETLPRTIEEYARKYTKILNKYLSDAESGITLTHLNLTDDDLSAFEDMVKTEALNAKVYDEIKKAVSKVRDLRKKDKDETIKEWNQLVEKYGNIQDKLILISKNGAQARYNIIKQFGSDEEESSSRKLLDNIMTEQDPEKIAKMMEDLMVRVNAIIARNPKAKVIIDAAVNQTNKDVSKAYWDDFKDSELYSMTFENMEKTSTHAIELIIEKLEELNDKVKEDPASMKALIGSLEKAQDQLVKRNPLQSFVQSFGELKKARQEVKTAMTELGDADGSVAYWEEKVKKLRDSKEVDKYVDAQDNLSKAKERQAKAQTNLVNAENKERTAKEKLVSSLNETQQSIQGVQGAFTALSEAFRAWGDEDTADMLGEIANGFAMIIPVVIAVAVAIKVLESTSVILLVISAALSVIIGMVNWLSGSSNKKITANIEEIERDVYDLEIAYKNLEHAASKAYGAMESGAKAALLANKQAQLEDLEKQLELAKSRTGKDYDQEEVNNYQTEIVDLRNEIDNLSQEITNDLLDISSAGDGVTDLVDTMIEAFKNGEDVMKAFSDKWDEMIDNMILKMLVTTFMQQAWDNVMNTLSDKEQEFLDKAAKEQSEAQKNYDRVLDMTDDEVAKLIADQLGYEKMKSADGYSLSEIEQATKRGEALYYNGAAMLEAWQQVTDEEIAAYRRMLTNTVNSADSATSKASMEYTKWALDYMNHEGRDYMMQYAEMLEASLGDWYTYGQDSKNELSALQQGIQGITETTGGALEAYMNGVSQQVYLQSDLLTQIRDSIGLFNSDVQVATMSQLLLQLQQSYTVQMAIQGILEGWSSPSGLAVRVEMS